MHDIRRWGPPRKRGAQKDGIILGTEVHCGSNFFSEYIIQTPN